jgi:hypothetical protein
MPAYLVTIQYRERTYELHSGRTPTMYSGSFVVVADGEAEARAHATAEFRRIEALSGVGWRRDVESLSVHREGGPDSR